MIVEFLGNSGAGKTTLIPGLIEFLQGRGLTAMSVTEAIHCYMRNTPLGRVVCLFTPQALRRPALWRVFSYVTLKLHIVGFTVQNPRLVYYVVASQLRRPIPWRHRRLILRLFLRMAGTYQFLRSRARPDEILVFDEGFAHRAVHLFVSESEQPDPEQIIAYLRLLPRSDLVVWVRASLDACLARIFARGLQVRLRGLETREVVRFVRNADQVVNVVSRYLEDSGWEIVRVENDGDPAMSAAELQRSVARILFPVPDAVGAAG